MKTTSKLQLNGEHKLIRDGQTVGRAWRYRVGPGFGVVIDGYYWRKGEVNQSGGSVGTNVKTLREALELADAVLDAAPATPEPKPTKGGAREGAGRPPAPDRPSPISWRPETQAQVAKWEEIGGAKWLRRALQYMIEGATLPRPDGSRTPDYLLNDQEAKACRLSGITPAALRDARQGVVEYKERAAESVAAQFSASQEAANRETAKVMVEICDEVLTGLPTTHEIEARQDKIRHELRHERLMHVFKTLDKDESMSRRLAGVPQRTEQDRHRDEKLKAERESFAAKAKENAKKGKKP